MNLKNFLVIFVWPFFARSVDEWDPEHEDEMVEELLAIGGLVQRLQLADGLGCKVQTKQIKTFNKSKKINVVLKLRRKHYFEV